MPEWVTEIGGIDKAGSNEIQETTGHLEAERKEIVDAQSFK